MSHLAHADAAEAKVAQIAAGTTTTHAAANPADRELGGAFSLVDLSSSGHSYFLKGMPSSVSRLLASSSLLAVVTMVISMPRTASIWS